MLFVPRKYHCRLRSLCGASFGPRKHVCGGQIILWVPGVVEFVIVLLNCDMDIMSNDRGVPWPSHVFGLTGVVVHVQLARSLLQAGGSSSFWETCPPLRCDLMWSISWSVGRGSHGPVFLGPLTRLLAFGRRRVCYALSRSLFLGFCPIHCRLYYIFIRPGAICLKLLPTLGC